MNSKFIISEERMRQIIRTAIKETLEDYTEGANQDILKMVHSMRSNIIDLSEDGYGVLYVDYDPQTNELFAGSASNAGISKNFIIQYDRDYTLDQNLEALVDEIYNAPVTESTKLKIVNETSRRQKASTAMNGWNKNVKTMAILTSENPRFEGSSDGDNKTNSDRRENLEKDLKLGHFAWFPVKGQYEGKENSYIIYNISLENALYLGQKFGQESIIFIDGSHCEYWEQKGDGKYSKTHERDMSQRLDMTNADDYFTQISRAFKFQIPFFDGSDENQKTMGESVKYVCETIQKRMKTLEEAKKRIENSMEAKSGYNRFCNRGELYGNYFKW